MEVVLKSLKDTQKLAQDLVRRLRAKGGLPRAQSRGPSVIALYGDLGAGKTTLVQFLARALGVKEKVLSPTFVIIKTFSLPKKVGRFKFLTHLDCYRLKSARDLLALGLADILSDMENIVAIEWPEKVERYLPQNTIRVYFEVSGEEERKVSVEISND